jgi:perosamine synthetase
LPGTYSDPTRAQTIQLSNISWYFSTPAGFIQNKEQTVHCVAERRIIMIPRLKPFLDLSEIGALLKLNRNSVIQFEDAFAKAFESQRAIAFPYGRSALWAFFKAMDIENTEIIIPAYTCSVVAHAVVLSGNIPCFVDSTEYDFNMNLDQVAASINESTRAVVATHLFGYPLDVKKLQDIVADAEIRWGHRIYIIQDCAHSFGARWQGRLVTSEPDIVLFGLGISKTITSIMGGMMTTNDVELEDQLRTWRNKHFTHAGWVKTPQRMAYLLAMYFSFNKTFYGFVNWLEEDTKLLNRFTKAYHLDDKIHFPPGSDEFMLNVEARVGLAQLHKYEAIINRRIANAHFYDAHLPEKSEWIKPPLVEGATYSHYVLRVPDRKAVMAAARKKGVQIGQLIEYSVPHTPPYRQYIRDTDCPNSLYFSNHTINLPVQLHLHENDLAQVIDSIR